MGGSGRARKKGCATVPTALELEEFGERPSYVGERCACSKRRRRSIVEDDQWDFLACMV